MQEEKDNRSTEYFEDQFIQMVKICSHRDANGHPRELTSDEIREILLKQLWTIVDFWVDLEDEPGEEKSLREKISGAIFSVLATFDGSSPGVPSFIIVPSPHEEDKNFSKQYDMNWFPRSTNKRVIDIGPLHEYWHQFDPKKTKEPPVKNK